ncbi:MAG: thiamine-phosphate kinase [Corynebacterium sp.]|nr:thiamine-phosphate kinase [Corynebacterium sp.]
MTVGDIGEDGVVALLQQIAGSARNGDDAAVLGPASPNSRTVVTTDMLVQDRHFRFDWSTPREIGRKAIVQNFADLAAMGSRPVAAVVALSLPAHTTVSFLTEFATGIKEMVDYYSAEFVGGDVTSGDRLVISVAAIGSLGGSLPALELNRARVGQTVIASGTLGHSAAGYALLTKFGRDGVPDTLTDLVSAHVAPLLNPRRGLVARATGTTSMTDNSDGLIHDLATLARASGVTIDLNSAAIAPDDLLIDAAHLLGVDPWLWVLSGGEDHTLVGTTRNSEVSGFRVIGRVVSATGEPVTIDGERPRYTQGWESL